MSSPLHYIDDEVFRIIGEFSNITFLSSGTFSVVFSATKGNEQFAIKIAKLTGSYDENQLISKEFLHECYMGSFLTPEALPSAYQHWIQIVGYGRAKYDDDRFNIFKVPQLLDAEKDLIAERYRDIIITRYAGDTTLAAWLSAKKQPATDRESRLIAFQISWALNAANTLYGFVHCDLKPENIVINTFSEEREIEYVLGDRDRFRIKYRVGDPQIVIIDLGASYVSVSVKPVKGPVPLHVYEYPNVRTPKFAAPETILKDVHFSASDMFSVASIMCSVLMHQSKGFTFAYKSYPPVFVQKEQIRNEKDRKYYEIYYLFTLMYVMRVYGDLENRDRNDPMVKMYTKFLKSDYFKQLETIPSYSQLYTSMLKERGEYTVMFVRDLFELFYQSRTQFKVDRLVKPGKIRGQKSFLAYGLNNALYHPYFVTSEDVAFSKVLSPNRPANIVFNLIEETRDSEYLSDSERQSLILRVGKVVSVLSEKSQHTESDETKVLLKNCLIDLLSNIPTADIEKYRQCYDLIFKVGLPKEFGSIDSFTTSTAQPVRKSASFFPEGTMPYSENDAKRVFVVLFLTELGLAALDEKNGLPNFPNYKAMATQMRILRGAGGKGNQTLDGIQKRFKNYAKDVIPQEYKDRGGDYALSLAKWKLGLISDVKNEMDRFKPSNKEVEFHFAQSLSQIVGALEEIERNPNYMNDDTKYNVDAIENDLILPIKAAFSNHIKTIEQDDALKKAFSYVKENESNTRYYHYLSVLANILNTLDREETVDPFLLERCRSEFTEIKQP